MTCFLRKKQFPYILIIMCTLPIIYPSILSYIIYLIFEKVKQANSLNTLYGHVSDNFNHNFTNSVSYGQNTLDNSYFVGIGPGGKLFVNMIRE